MTVFPKYVDRKMLVRKIGKQKADIVEKLIKVNTEIVKTIDLPEHGIYPAHLVYEDVFRKPMFIEESGGYGAPYYFYTFKFIEDEFLDNYDLKKIIISRTSALIKKIVVDKNPVHNVEFDVKREMRLMNDFYEKFRNKYMN